MNKKKFRTIFSNKSQVKTLHKNKPDIRRINQLSQPKVRIDLWDDSAGPGAYNPKDLFLSTKSKSPSVSIGKSERFIRNRLRKIDFKTPTYLIENSIGRYIPNYDMLPPRYTFERTGHNLKLVENPGYPGVGRYSPKPLQISSSYTFKKAKKIFSWKKGN